MEFSELAKRISAVDIKKLAGISSQIRSDILAMTTLSKSGHPGGSMSSIDILLSLYSVANINKDNFSNNLRDKIIVSQGHISPAVYLTLAEMGFYNIDEVVSTFRKAGSLFEGHIERSINGVEWSTGNLGQGLSAGAGMAIADRVNGIDNDIYVLMGDGEQEKGQIAEARRFIKKYALNNITVIVDYNRLQISGDIHAVMPPLDVAKSFESDGWLVIEIDGHNYADILGAILKAKSADLPVMIMADTVMGKGVSFMENKAKYHGSPLSDDDYNLAVTELKCENKLNYYRSLRSQFKAVKANKIIDDKSIVKPVGTNILYDKNSLTDNRSASGTALLDIMDNVATDSSLMNIIVFDCDLAGSVKTDAIEKKYPNRFFQSGIAEHNTATMAGASSVNGVIPVFADFGMFGVDEVYNQHRLNGINDTNLKVITTHVGTDVGEDGKTHQCIDYLSLMRNIFGFKVITPADPNQTDRALRYAISAIGNIHIAMGRSKIPAILKDDGEIFFGADYIYEYGKVDILRAGDYPIFTYGAFVHRALKVRDILLTVGINVAVINVSSPLFISDDLSATLSNGYAFVYEDHISSGGLFSTISQLIASEGYACKLSGFGINQFAGSGTPDEILHLLDIDEPAIASKIEKILKEKR